MLFNFQGPNSLRYEAYLFYHISFRLSSTFFKVFQTLSSCAPSFQTAYLFYHLKLGLSSFFKNFFEPLSRPPLSRVSFIILSHPPPFVNTFFHYFFIFFSFPYISPLYPLPVFFSIQKNFLQAEYFTYNISN